MTCFRWINSNTNIEKMGLYWKILWYPLEILKKWIGSETTPQEKGLELNPQQQSEEWGQTLFYAIKDQDKSRPFTLEQLKHFVAKGALQETHQIIVDNTRKLAKEIPGLFSENNEETPPQKLQQVNSSQHCENQGQIQKKCGEEETRIRQKKERLDQLQKQREEQGCREIEQRKELAQIQQRNEDLLSLIQKQSDEEKANTKQQCDVQERLQKLQDETKVVLLQCEETQTKIQWEREKQKRLHRQYEEEETKTKQCQEKLEEIGWLNLELQTRIKKQHGEQELIHKWLEEEKEQSQRKQEELSRIQQQNDEVLFEIQQHHEKHIQLQKQCEEKEIQNQQLNEKLILFRQQHGELEIQIQQEHEKQDRLRRQYIELEQILELPKEQMRIQNTSNLEIKQEQKRIQEFEKKQRRQPSSITEHAKDRIEKRYSAEFNKKQCKSLERMLQKRKNMIMLTGNRVACYFLGQWYLFIWMIDDRNYNSFVMPTVLKLEDASDADKQILKNDNLYRRIKDDAFHVL